MDDHMSRPEDPEDPEDPEERVARIRARRGTPEFEALVQKNQRDKLAQPQWCRHSAWSRPSGVA